MTRLRPVNTREGAEERGLEGSDAIGLLRRAEIVVAGTTIAAGIGPGDERPHGYDTILPPMDATGVL